jgi:hypothetical protein
LSIIGSQALNSPRKCSRSGNSTGGIALLHFSAHSSSGYTVSGPALRPAHKPFLENVEEYESQPVGSTVLLLKLNIVSLRMDSKAQGGNANGS